MKDGKSDSDASELAARTVNKGRSSSVESSWNVLALGEMQQPGGVGAADHNPVLDGMNPTMDYSDNAANGFEQEVALKRWVDLAVDMLNRGDDPEVVLAKLAHDGCPEPETVLQRAIEQPADEPDEAPVTDEPLSAPMPVTGPMDEGSGVGMPMGVQSGARVTVRGLPATVIGSYKGQWSDDEIIRVAFDSGQLMDVRPDDMEAVAEAVQEPVQVVQEFIDSFPAVDEGRRSSIEDRIANIKTARQRISSIVSSFNTDERQRLALDAMDVHLHTELSERSYQLKNFTTEADAKYAAELPRFETTVVEQESTGHGYKSAYFLDDEVAEQQAHLANEDFDKIMLEDSAILISELPEATLNDLGQVHQMASSYIDDKTAGMDAVDRDALRGRFVEAVIDEREKQLALDNTPDEAPVDETTTELGPAESLFM